MAKRRNYGSGNLVKRGPYWYMRYIDASGERVEQSTKCADRGAAEAQLTIALGEVAAGTRIRSIPGSIKVRDACALVVADYKSRRAATTGGVKARIANHIEPALGNVPLARLTKHGLLAYAHARLDEGAAAASVNRELAIIRRGLNLAREQEPPWIVRVPKFEMLREDNVRTGFLDQAQYERLRKELPEHLQIALVIGYHTGIRIGTIRALRLDQVDMAAKIIRIGGSQVKNKTGHPIPIYGDMEGYISIALSANKKYLCEAEGEMLGLFRKSWASATKRAGLEGLLFHDLRRSAVRNMLDAGIPEATAMKITGHKTHSMFQRYNIVVERDIQRAGVKLAAFFEIGEKIGEKPEHGEKRRIQ